MPDHVHLRVYLEKGLPEPLKTVGSFVRRFKTWTTRCWKLQAGLEAQDGLGLGKGHEAQDGLGLGKGHEAQDGLGLGKGHEAQDGLGLGRIINSMLAGWLVAALVIVVWGMTFASTRVLLVDFSALEILVIRFALAWMTLAIVAAHNHPGGTLKASPGNVTLTRELSKAADLLGGEKRVGAR